MSRIDEAVADCCFDKVLDSAFIFEVHFSNQAIDGFNKHYGLAGLFAAPLDSAQPPKVTRERYTMALLKRGLAQLRAE